MLAFIKANYKVGDALEVNCSEGAILGQIEYVSNTFIVLRQNNGNICGIAATDIRSFKAAEPVHEEPTQELFFTGEEDNADACNESSNADEPQETLRDILGNDIKEAPSADELVAPEAVGQPKVIGKIDLAKLQRLDPRMNRRSYFKSGTFGSDTDNAPDTDSPFVSARGKITYYNNEKHYGFIRDFNSDTDLYFFAQQVVESALYENLRKGLKVVYSVGQNAQGVIATCIHFPHTADELYDMAENQFDARRYNFAKTILEHILECAPDYEQAKQLIEEINETQPQNDEPRYARHNATGVNKPAFNGKTVYAEAKKAYLDKDFARAEELYAKAIEEGDKPESCVKDMLTYYVSRFKQGETDEEKAEAKAKATTYLEEHKQRLSDNLTTKQFLALNYYLPLQEYTKFIEVVDDILANWPDSEAPTRKAFYYWQKSIALNKLGQVDDALALIDEGLEIAPKHRQLLNLRDYILSPEKPEEETSAAPSAEEE